MTAVTPETQLCELLGRIACAWPLSVVACRKRWTGGERRMTVGKNGSR